MMERGAGGGEGGRERGRERERSTGLERLLLESCAACANEDGSHLARYHANARYRGISLIRNNSLLGPYSRTTSRAIRWP